MSRVTDLFDFVRVHHPRNLRGIEEAAAVEPVLFLEVAERFLSWAATVHGEAEYLPRCVGNFALFSSDVLMAQARYEADGHYENSSFAACEAEVYGRRDVMDDYLWGVFLTNFLWSHHMEISSFYLNRFVKRLPANAQVLEIAPGHGGWGVWMLSERPDARVEAFDISPSSIAIASSVAAAAGVADRATYTRRNALELDALAPGSKDAVICSFLIEHLETPERLVEVIAHHLKPGARAYLTGAITAAQIDHIYEFHRESELVLMAEKYGLRVVETLSVSPQRILPRAKFLPRSMALILQRYRTDRW